MSTKRSLVGGYAPKWVHGTAFSVAVLVFIVAVLGRFCARGDTTITYEYDLNDRLYTAKYSGDGNPGMTYMCDDTGNVFDVSASGSAPPAIGIDQAVAALGVVGAPFVLTGTVSDTATRVRILVNGVESPHGGSLSRWFAILDLSLGNNTISVYALDGNGLASDTNTFTLNCQPAPSHNAEDVPLLPPWASVALFIVIVGLALYQLRRRGTRLNSGMGLLAGLLVGVAGLGCPLVQAQDENTLGPGWYLAGGDSDMVYTADAGSAAVPDPSSGLSFDGITGPITTTYISGQPVIAETITPEITALARNLENSPTRIYDYVHNYIQYVHYFGSRKGALMTLLEGSGNDFDQCALLASLLRAASANLGKNWKVTYQFGIMPIPYQDPNNAGADLEHWLGLSISSGTWADRANQVGIFNQRADYPNYLNPGYVFVLSSDGAYNTLALHRLWLKLVDDAGTYYLDPAFKISDPIAGIDMKAAAQIVPETLLSQAASGGATVNTNYVQNLNWNAMTSTLTTWTANFLNDLQQMRANLSVDQVLSGYAVRETTTPSEQTFPGLPYGPITDFQALNHSGSIHVPALEWDNIPSNYMARIELLVDNIDAIYAIPSLNAGKLSLTFSSSQAVISLDDAARKTGSGGAGSSATMTTKFLHPAGVWNYTTNGVALSGADDQSDNGLSYSRAAP